MPVSFSAAAFQRIVRGLDPFKTAAPDAPLHERLQKLADAAVDEGLPPQWEFDVVMRDLFGREEAAARLIALIALVDLAQRCGYINLSEIEPADQTAVTSAAVRVRDTLFGGIEDPAYSSAKGLIARTAAGEFPSPAFDSQTFGSFESYLNLTLAVWSDDECLRFLSDTHWRWSPEMDAPFLVSPRHFAAALVQDPALPVPGPNPEGGLIALQYLDWFMNILRHVDAHQTLQDDLVRHARWAYNVDTIAARVGHWASHMTEWDPSGKDVEGEATWEAFRQRLSVELHAHQRRLGVGLPPVVRDVALPTVVVTIAKTAEELRAEGRIGAARQQARDRAASLFVFLQSADPSVWKTNAMNFTEACNMLAEFGDTDLAAAYLAPFLDHIFQWISETPTAHTARRIVATARGAAPPSSEPSINVTQRATPRPGDTARQQSRNFDLDNS
jgi:hypothetical protein